MKRNPVLLLAFLVVSLVLLTACGQAAAPAPTQAPAAPAKPAATEPTKAPAAAKAEPTKAPAAAPTAAPAAKASFPTNGKTVQIIVPYSAGGANDVAARLLAPLLEKELGTPFQILNKPGASGMVGWTEMVNSKPDGYTLSYTIFAPVITNYLDAEKKATYSRDDFQTLGNHFTFPIVLSVQKESPYQTLKDLIDAAMAKPGEIKAATTGILGTPHLGSLQFQKETGVKFAGVQFDGGAPAITALLGGHVDASFNPASEVVPHVKSGNLRVLGIMDRTGTPLLPDAKTMEEQGYKVYMVGASGVSAPKGVSDEVVDVLGAAIKASVSNPEHQKKLQDLGYTPHYLGSQEYSDFWSEYEQQLKPLIDMAKAEISAKS